MKKTYKNINKKTKGVLYLSGVFLALLSNINNTYASDKTEPYYWSGTVSEYDGFVDPEIPPAVKLKKSIDGMPAGTILYRTEYLGFTYYCPATPEELQDTDLEVNSTKYRKWGPWDMPINQVAYQETVVGNIEPGFIPSSYSYSTVTIPKGTTVQGIKINSEGGDYRTTLGTLNASYTGKIKSVTDYKGINDPHVYFDLTGTNLEGVGAVNIGRVPVSKITTKGKINFYYKDSRPIYDNFPQYGKYADRDASDINIISDDSHTYVEQGKWVNPSYAPYDLGGKNGEWVYLGYNADGDVLKNPYSLETSLYFRGNSALKEFDMRYTPWNPTDSKPGEEEKKKEFAYQEFPKRTKYDTDSKYYNTKYNLIKSLIQKGVFFRRSNLTLKQDVEDMLNRISFRNHPVNEASVMMVQRRMNESTRYFTVFNELSDIYLHTMRVKDKSGNVVGFYTYDVNTGNVERKHGENIKAGEKYTVEVYLGNAKNRDIIATKNQSQIGLTTNYKEQDYLTIGETKYTQSKEVPNTMTATKGSKSSVMTYTITAPESDFFDIYGYVGYKHMGTDNLDYTNDIGRIRMNITDIGATGERQESKADLVAKKIELLDSNDKVVYSYTRGASEPSVNKAIVPGNTYNIRYTIVNEGDDAKYRVNNPGRWEGDNWIPGGWSDWIYYDCTINSQYQYSRIVSDSSSAGNDVVPPSQEHGVSNEVELFHEGKRKIKIYKDTEITYTRNNIVFEYPYLNTTFSFTTSNDNVNSDKTNDSLTTVINPKYDAVISNVRIFPKNEYIADEKKKTSYVVMYDATLDTEDFIKKGDANMLIETSININNKTVFVTDLLSVGENKNIAHSVDVNVSKEGVRTATVILNYHKHTYETDYSNNKGVAKDASVRKINNPFEGNIKDKVTKVDTSNGSSLAGGGDLNNNCLIPRTENNWSITHRKLSWSATNKSYTSISGDKQTFKKYTEKSDEEVTNNYKESFKIESVLFKSKTTKDKGLGDDGWVNLADASQKDLGLIKAGYGFELKVIAKYKTNVDKIMPQNSMTSNGTSGVEYSSISNADINLPAELFIELPGTNQKRKILSTTGYEGTTKGLILDVEDESTSSETIKKLTYTIKSVTTLGIKESNKIFIPTSLKNGDYKISVYTSPTVGTATANKPIYSTMCDRKDLTIKVKGSYTDDLNSHITQ